MCHLTDLEVMPQFFMKSKLVTLEEGETPEGVSFKATSEYFFSAWTVGFRYSILCIRYITDHIFENIKQRREGNKEEINVRSVG